MFSLAAFATMTATITPRQKSRQDAVIRSNLRDRAVITDINVSYSLTAQALQHVLFTGLSKHDKEREEMRVILPFAVLHNYPVFN